MIHIDKVLSKYDLYIEKKLTLHEYYFKCKFSFLILGNNDVEVNYMPGKRVEILHGLGLPYIDIENKDTKEINKIKTEADDQIKRGDFFVYFELELCPNAINNMTEEDIEIFKKLSGTYFKHNM
jgi:hypothetical protein